MDVTTKVIGLDKATAKELAIIEPITSGRVGAIELLDGSTRYIELTGKDFTSITSDYFAEFSAKVRSGAALTVGEVIILITYAMYNETAYDAYKAEEVIAMLEESSEDESKELPRV